MEKEKSFQPRKLEKTNSSLEKWESAPESWTKQEKLAWEEVVRAINNDVDNGESLDKAIGHETELVDKAQLPRATKMKILYHLGDWNRELTAGPDKKLDPALEGTETFEDIHEELADEEIERLRKDRSQKDPARKEFNPQAWQQEMETIAVERQKEKKVPLPSKDESQIVKEVDEKKGKKRGGGGSSAIGSGGSSGIIEKKRVEFLNKSHEYVPPKEQIMQELQRRLRLVAEGTNRQAASRAKVISKNLEKSGWLNKSAETILDSIKNRADQEVSIPRQVSKEVEKTIDNLVNL